MKILKSYSEMILLPTFEERLAYLKIGQTVGMETFGFDRILNQALYTSHLWREVKQQAIIRDNGCDLAIPDMPIVGRIIVHHINPITEEDIIRKNPDIFNLDYLVCTSLITHNRVHYKDLDEDKRLPLERHPGDTKLW